MGLIKSLNFYFFVIPKEGFGLEGGETGFFPLNSPPNAS